jgi:heme-degrading monooxygenase HmoA
MFARTVSVQLKPSMLTNYTSTFEKEVLPLLRKQKGFQNEITLCNPTSLYLTAISLWETREDAELYSKNAYAEALKLLSKTIDGTPKVRGEEVVETTIMPKHETVAA